MEESRETKKTSAPAVEEKQKLKNQKEEVPFFHYLGIYKTLDPEEIAARCRLPFEERAFALRLVGTEYRIPFPDFALGDAPMAEKILILRYLCGGRSVAPRGKQVAYQEIPWGNVYYQNFQGRCILRFARTFGSDLEAFRRVMAFLQAEPLPQSDAGYRFEFIPGLSMSLLLWAGDEEFSPSGQILFDDNFEFAFTAEDIAVVGETVLRRLKILSAQNSF
ncbi:MAG: DUF3786 domain-containing protein [Spirochaetaceae bacterium]|jgi:hypothetical protein|nr:DUF3786 domain-containing protein [Spirochaetaceae bacterium]